MEFIHLLAPVLCAHVGSLASQKPALIPFYIVSAIVWALAMNIVRVTAIAVAQDWYSVDLAHGWKHEYWDMLVWLWLDCCCGQAIDSS